MGCASSAATPEEAAAAVASKGIDRALRKERSAVKILLLGAGDSGKSTVMKQLCHIHRDEFASAERRKEFASTAVRNLVEACESRLSAVKAALEEGSGVASTASTSRVGLTERLRTYDERLVSAESRGAPPEPPDADTARELRRHYRALERTNPEIHRRTELASSEAGAYFFGEAERVLAEDYVPSVEDCLRCRMRTTGIVEADLEVAGNLFRIVDVGGQRTERQKWIHCFEDVHAVVFCASVVDYDRTVPEDDKVGRMDESLALFRETCASPWFERSAIVLFLNKCDLLAERLRKSPFADHCPGYRGENAPEAVLEFLEARFVEQNTKGRIVYAYTTCATDTQGVRRVFEAVRDTAVKRFVTATGM